jgi:hypothetical protein
MLNEWCCQKLGKSRRTYPNGLLGEIMRCGPIPAAPLFSWEMLTLSTMSFFGTNTVRGWLNYMLIHLAFLAHKLWTH